MEKIYWKKLIPTLALKLKILEKFPLMLIGKCVLSLEMFRDYVIKFKLRIWLLYRTSSFTASNSYIPLTYDAIRQSSETTGSLDTATGIFTAPIKGAYQFSMMAIEVSNKNEKPLQSTRLLLWQIYLYFFELTMLTL